MNTFTTRSRDDFINHVSKNFGISEFCAKNMYYRINPEFGVSNGKERLPWSLQLQNALVYIDVAFNKFDWSMFQENTDKEIFKFLDMKLEKISDSETWFGDLEKMLKIRDSESNKKALHLNAKKRVSVSSEKKQSVPETGVLQMSPGLFGILANDEPEDKSVQTPQPTQQKKKRRPGSKRKMLKKSTGKESINFADSDDSDIGLPKGFFRKSTDATRQSSESDQGSDDSDFVKVQSVTKKRNECAETDIERLFHSTTREKLYSLGMFLC